MDLKSLGKTIIGLGAPLLGSVIAGPAGTIIGQVVADMFGGDINDPDDILKRIRNDPESAIKLRQIQADEAVNLQRFAFLQAELAVKNTVDARANNVASKTVFPEVISVMILIGFFGCVYWIAVYPQENFDKDILNILLGVIGSAFAAVVNYWLGSSMDRKK